MDILLLSRKNIISLINYEIVHTVTVHSVAFYVHTVTFPCNGVDLSAVNCSFLHNLVYCGWIICLKLITCMSFHTVLTIFDA